MAHLHQIAYFVPLFGALSSLQFHQIASIIVVFGGQIYYAIVFMSFFVGREDELQKIRSLASQKESAILIVYGRRRVGKTTLVETALADRSILKIEGLQGKDGPSQRSSAIKQLARLVGDPYLGFVSVDSWFEFFEVVDRQLQKNPAVLYFEELQWLANYEDDFVADLKYFWDNSFRKIPGFLLVLCGSSPSFMINRVIRSKALYNRSYHSINLQPFTLKETLSFLGEAFSPYQRLEAFLTVGGIPEYLNYLRSGKSLLLTLCQHSFQKDSFFSTEYDRLFVSSLGDNPHYQRVIEFLARIRFATRDQILAHIGRDSGGDISLLLQDLEQCGFISTYRSFHSPESTRLVRYQIEDPYLQFYYKFVAPRKREILLDSYRKKPSEHLNSQEFQTWLGYAFERWCRSHHTSIAQILKFAAVRYSSGAFFSRSLESDVPGFQWDLVFDRRDRVLTLCEIKMNTIPLSVKAAHDFERRLELFPKNRKSAKTVEKVLIAPGGITDELRDSGYFDSVITLTDLLA
jgi:AAA+ ATPase superfamily predicted ATPase